MTPWLQQLRRDYSLDHDPILREIVGETTHRGVAARGQPTPKTKDKAPPPKQTGDGGASDPRVKELQRRLKTVEPASRSKKDRETDEQDKEMWAKLPHSTATDQYWI